MKTTKNYGFKKPEQTDFYNVEDFNANMDIIDEKLKFVEENSSNGGMFKENVTVPDNLDFGAKGTVGNYGNETVVVAKNQNDASKQRYISIMNETAEPDVAKALGFVDVKDGAYNVYRIYGDHNKPKSSDVKAFTYGTDREYINENVDLNTFTKIGLFKCTVNGTVATLKNCPTNEAFTLDILSATGESSEIDVNTYSYLLQRITTLSGKQYVRDVNSDGAMGIINYGKWKRVLDTSDIVDNLESTSKELPLSANMGREILSKMSEFVTYDWDEETQTLSITTS